MTVQVFPAAPAEGDEVVVALSGVTPNASSANPPVVHVDGTTIDVTVDVLVGGLTILGRYAQTAVLPPLPVGLGPRRRTSRP